VSQRFGLYSKKLFSVCVNILSTLKEGDVINNYQLQTKEYCHVKRNLRLVQFPTKGQNFFAAFVLSKTSAVNIWQATNVLHFASL